MKLNFWSSTESRGFMAGLIRELREQGIEARHCFSVSEVDYRRAHGTCARLLLRFRQYFEYPLKLVVELLWARFRGEEKKNHWLVVNTNTFYAPLVASLCFPNVVHLVYDLFPEAAIVAGKWSPADWKTKLCRWIVGLTLNRCELNVFLGARLERHARKIYGGQWSSCVIPVGGDRRHFPLTPIFGTEGERLTVLYCGNLGKMHDLDTLFAYWQNYRCRFDIHWRFQCFGPGKTELTDQHLTLHEEQRKQITIGDSLEADDWVVALQTAPLSLVTMKAGSEQVVFPSKVYSAMLAGSALLVVAPEDSDLVDLVKKSDAGWWVAPGQAESLRLAIEEAAGNPNLLMQRRKNAYTFAQKSLGQDSMALRWIEELNTL